MKSETVNEIKTINETITEQLDKVKKKDLMPENEIVEVKSLYQFDNKNIRHFANKIKYTWNRNHNIIINMELLNGESVMFFVKANYKGFLFRKKRYIIDTTYKYYSQTFKNYILDFHEEFCLPIKKSIHVKQIRKSLKVQQLEVENMLNPYILEQFIKSELAEGLLKGSAINERLKMISIWVIVGAIASIGMLLLYMYINKIIKIPA